MKYLLTVTFLAAVAVLFLVPTTSFAGDTLTVAVSNSMNLDQQINSDTVAGGANAHKVYLLTTTNQTYWIDGPITSKSSISIVGKAGASGVLPCIQPHTQSDNTVPVNMLVFNGANTVVNLQNLYLLGLSNTNTTDAVNGANACAIQISADKITLWVNNCVFDEWRAFAIGYNGQWDKFFVFNSKFRNMVDPTQQYIGEVIRNEWPGAAYTDSMIFRYNTFLCVNGYAAGPVTKYYQRYFEFSHNDVVYTVKNPFFIFNETNAKIDNNIFYGNYAGGVNFQETPWWDNLWFGDADVSVMSFEELNGANAAALDPADSAGFFTKSSYIGAANAADSAADDAWVATLQAKAEKMRTIEVKNNCYFQPSGITSFWTSLNDTAHFAVGFDSLVTPTWMNSRTTRLFSSPTTEPGFVQSGNTTTKDPVFATSISSDVLTGATGDGVGLLKYIVEIRGGTAATDRWGFQRTTVGSGSWMPTWPLPETNALKYTGSLSSTDALPVGDPFWFTGTLSGVAPSVAMAPKAFSLSEAYPNPFNPSTNIRYTLATAGLTSLRIYNVLGQLVKTVVDNVSQEAGTYTVHVDMSNVTSGVYFYALEQGQNRLVHKMMLLK
ncbi:MAG TPA: T9SS type A sorting domain-containing protein [Bacteroidota bacterium]|nr:T9SS type A sorting domain-containing protein [Bacteroidota bacterium]